MKAWKVYNTEAINRFHQRRVHSTEAVEIPQDDPPEPSVPDTGPSDLPESELAIPDDPILDFVNSNVTALKIWIRLCRLTRPTDRIPSTNPGAEPPRDARDSASARLHSMHLETSSSDRP